MQILRSNFSITENCIRFRSWVTYEVNILFAAWFLAFIIPRNRHNFTRRVPSTHSVLRLWIFLPIEHDVLHLIDVRFFRRRRRRCRCCCCCCCSQFIQSFRSRIKHCCSCVAKNAKESVGDGEVRRWWRWRRNSDDSEFIDVTEFGLASQNRFHDLFLFVNSHLHSNWIYIYTFIEYAKRQNAVIFCLFVVRFFTSIFTAVLCLSAHTRSRPLWCLGSLHSLRIGQLYTWLHTYKSDALMSLGCRAQNVHVASNISSSSSETKME